MDNYLKIRLATAVALSAITLCILLFCATAGSTPDGKGEFAHDAVEPAYFGLEGRFDLRCQHSVEAANAPAELHKAAVPE